MNEKLQEAKKAYDLEVKDIKVSDAVAAYVKLLEEENRKYLDWWLEANCENKELNTIINELRAEVSHYRTVIAHEFNRK